MRPKKHRNIKVVPKIRFFKPQGTDSENTMMLSDEELEALRLKNLENLDQESAAHEMGVSQSTFQRIITGLYKKLAIALTEGRPISIVKDEKEQKIECWECDSKVTGKGQSQEIVCRPCDESEVSNF